MIVYIAGKVQKDLFSGSSQRADPGLDTPPIAETQPNPCFLALRTLPSPSEGFLVYGKELTGEWVAPSPGPPGSLEAEEAVLPSIVRKVTGDLGGWLG